MFCSGVLRSQFGRRPSRAVDRAMMQLAAEEALADTSARSVNHSWRQRIHAWPGLWQRVLRPYPALSFALGLVLAGLTGWLVWSQRTVNGRETGSSAPVCLLSDASGVRWASGSAQPKAGDALSLQSFQLEAGVVELTFNSSAKVAVEGPAVFRLTGTNSMELKSGKVATIVPKKAHGFALRTTTAKVVDLGTRFGAIIDGDQSSEVDVFQGRVRLTDLVGSADATNTWHLTQGMAMLVGAHGATPATALPETAFPQPNLEVEVRPQNCGFDVSARAALGGIPLDFGYWSGPAYSLTGAVQGITPANGNGMLRFLDDPNLSTVGDSAVWQLVDLSGYKKLLAGGQVRADLSAMFNRARGDAHSSDQFGLTLAAFHGTPADIKSLWAKRETQALALADKVLTADDNLATWETVKVSAQLPPETDFVVVELRAIAPAKATGKAPVYPGNFADLVDLNLCTSMRPSSIVTGQ